MSRIASFFKSPTRKGQKKRKALIAYLIVGYPSVATTLEVVPALVEGGCDMIELGIPFSDPLADGATIQRASHRALQQGVTPQLCLEVASELRQRVDIPLIFMSYYNPLLHYGLDAFCADSSGAGIDGLIVPDLPPEEGAGLEAVAAKKRLDLIYLLALTTTEERLRLVTDKSRGFIYVVSLKGVTGARNVLPPDLEGFIGRVRSVTTKPLCVGFGIATPEQARRVASLADGVIIGSRILDIVESSDQPATAAGDFIREIRKALSPHDLV
ncbi:MAG TPA: tryptophan synthase subunit alpha [Dehalococcoidia bacterium]|nr:tryptophan synthase subunit alpha [Dehalococcoidia bacterium]